MRIATVLVLLLVLAACQENQGLLTPGVVSYRITLKQPGDLGTEGQPLDEEGPHAVVFDVEALGARGERRTDYDAELDAWVFFGGSLSPLLDSSGRATVALVAGEARDVTRALPVAFGPTTIWIEDVRRVADGTPDCLGPYPPTGGGPGSCSYATGSSAAIHYRNPYLDEVQRPLDPASARAPFQTLLERKAVYVDHPRDPDGMLVVTSAAAQAFTVTDVSTSAQTRGYNHVYVFSFSRAKRGDGTAVAPGDVVVACPGGVCGGYLAGGVKEFVGFTELDFPIFDIAPPAPDAPECRCGLSFRSDGARCDAKVWAPCPDPVPLDPAWLLGLVADGDPAGELSAWSLGGFSDQNSTAGRVYGTWTHPGADYVVTLFQDPARTVQVSQGRYTPAGATEWPQTIQLLGALPGSVVARGFAADNPSLVIRQDPNQQRMESLEAALVKVRDARVCAYTDADWQKYGQIKVDFGAGCNLAVAFKGVVPGFDPLVAPGQQLPEIVGTLRNLAGPSSSDPTATYSNWILNPRAAEDVDCGAAAGCAP